MIDEFFNKNYTKLLDIAKKYNKRYASELVSDLYIHIQKYSNKTEQDLLYISIAFIKSEVQWGNSKFNKTYCIREHTSPECVDMEDRKVEENIYLSSDVNTLFTRDYLSDLNNDWSEEQIKRIIRVNLYLKNLQLHELILYDLWINKCLSYRAMSRQIGIPISSIRRMVNELNKKIKAGI